MGNVAQCGILISFQVRALGSSAVGKAYCCSSIAAVTLQTDPVYYTV